MTIIPFVFLVLGVLMILIPTQAFGSLNDDMVIYERLAESNEKLGMLISECEERVESGSTGNDPPNSGTAGMCINDRTTSSNNE